MAGRDFIQNPGPTNIPDRVLEAFRRPAVGFSGPEFDRLVKSLWTDLPRLFDCDAIIVYTAVGHGAWEGALTNLLDPGETALVVTGGRFGIRWAEVAEQLGYRVETTPLDARRSPDPAAVHEVLAADTAHRIRAVCVCQTETSTGTVADVAAIRRAIDTAGHPALLVVDAVAAFATEPLEPRAWGVDVVIAASQKGLMMPPGLSFCGLSQRAVERSYEVTTPRFYWSWPRRLDDEYVYYRFGGTPPEQHLYALRAAIDMIDEEGGLPAVWARHRRMAGAVHAAVAAWGEGGPWELNAVEPAERASAITCVRSGDVDADALIHTARRRFHVSLGGGMLDMAGHALRIGHLGDLNEPMVLGALAAIETTMSYLGQPYGPGVSRAATELARTSAP